MPRVNPDTSKPVEGESAYRKLSPLTLAIEAAIRSIPSGRVSTYGRIAREAGLPNGARQVVRVLHSRACKESLPWHRVLARCRNEELARIALDGDGFHEQKALLVMEGVAVADDGTVDFCRFGFY